MKTINQDISCISQTADIEKSIYTEHRLTSPGLVVNSIQVEQVRDLSKKIYTSAIPFKAPQKHKRNQNNTAFVVERQSVESLNVQSHTTQ